MSFAVEVALGVLVVVVAAFVGFALARPAEEASLEVVPANEEVQSLARAGRKIEAIRAYRAQTGAGLKAAKKAIEALERGEPLPGAAGPAVASAEFERLARGGQHIEAIRLYREQTGAGLKEAKEAVEALERGEPLPSRSVSTEGLAEIERLAGEGRVIDAIRLYREQTGSGLKEAKEMVERIRDGG